jgi:hypothetical protein
VNGNLSLHSDDLQLRALWEQAEQKVPPFSADAEMLLQRYLENAGYRIE